MISTLKDNKKSKTKQNNAKQNKNGLPYKNRCCLPDMSTDVHPRSVLSILLVFCIVLCCVFCGFIYFFVFVLFSVWQMLPLSLDCPFLMVSSVSSNGSLIRRTDKVVNSLRFVLFGLQQHILQSNTLKHIYIYYICCSYVMYRVDSSNNELPGALGKSTCTVILTIQTSLVSRHTQ